MNTSDPEPHEAVCYWRIAPVLLKVQTILSDTTVRRSAVDREDHTGNQKKGHISLGGQQCYYLKVFQGLY